jgi:hypothetical protein
MTLTLKLMTITPAMAQAILDQDAPNRPIKRHNIERYANDMTNGWWRQTGESIVFDQDGRLVQGQHRIHAVIRSGVAIEFVVVCGVDSVAQDVMDTGARRSLGDQLARRGEKNCNALASAVLLTKTWDENGKPHANSGVSHVELLQWFMDHQEIRDSVTVVYTFARKMGYPSGLAAAVHYQMSRLSPLDADEFWDVFGTGKPAVNSQPILLLRERMIKDLSARDRGQTLKPVYRAALTIRSWNAWVTGAELGLVKWLPQRSEFPVLINPNDL